MNGTIQRWLRVFVVTAVTALMAWKWLPGTALDRTWFSWVAASSANGPLFISGEGTREDAWKLRTFSTERKADRREAPVIVSLGDDVEGFFQNSPPAPIDLAVILTNFQRLGAKKAATAAMFAWEKPDAIGLAALEKALAGFDSLVMAAPLSRGVVPTVMPPSFRRCSLPVSKVHGDASVLPVVNRLPIPGIILGGETTITGFSTLEAEAPSELTPLVARWDDRLVFSFQLLTVMQRLDLPLDDIEVRLGEYLKLSPAGPLVPIDEFGRLALPLKKLSAYKEISAEALIDGGDDLFPKEAPEPVILRDDQSAAESATRAFSKNLSAVIATIASNGGLSDAREFSRLAEGGELAIFVLLVLALAFLGGATDFVRYLGMLVLAVVAVAAQWIAAGSGSLWLPGLPVLVTIAVGVVGVVAVSVPHRKIAPAPVVTVPEPAILPPVEAVPEAEISVSKPAKPAKPPTKRTSTRKKAEDTGEKPAVAKKAAAKKTAAKKTAAKPRARKPVDGGGDVGA